MLLAVVVLSSWGPSPVMSFIPSPWKDFFARLAEVNFAGETAVRHDIMTRKAILNIAAELLSSNPYDAQSQHRINALGQDFEESDLIAAYYGQSNRHVTNKFKDAIKEITDANAAVDSKEDKIETKIIK